MANIVMFCILAVVILGAAVMSVATKRIMRSVTYLLIVLFGVAGLYFLLDYTFLGAAQIAVYAGGVTMLFIFAIQMVNKRALEGAVEKLKAKSIVRGVLLAVVGLVTVLCVLAKNRLIDNVVEAIYKTRVFVLSSNTEGMPNTLIEAMILGLTVVSTDCPCGGPAELITHGVNGLLSPVKDEIAMKENLQYVLNNLHEADGMANEAAKTSDIYDADKVYLEWENYLNKLIFGKKAGNLRKKK